MQLKIKELISFISDDIVCNLPQSFEKTYYGKMKYSDENTIFDFDNELLIKTIGFEIVFIHVTAYLLTCSIRCSQEYEDILSVLDADSLFSWYKIKDNMLLQLNGCNVLTGIEIYDIIKHVISKFVGGYPKCQQQWF